METMINTESRAVRAIIGIAHAAGIAEMYLNTLDRIFNTVLFNQDDLGMSDKEAISTLQTLGLLRCDISDIAADKNLARALGVGRQMTDEAAAVSVETFTMKADWSTKEESPDLWRLILDALNEGSHLLAQRTKESDETGEITEILEDIAKLRDRLESLAEWKATNDRYPEFAGNNFGVERLRAFLYVANQKAIGLMEMVNDIVDDMQRMERNKAEIAEIREAADLALHAAKITKQALEREDARATGTQEGADE